MGVGSGTPREDETMTIYACYLNDSGDNVEVTGESLENIRNYLFAAGYEGPKVVVTKANDEVVGWADATDYKSN